MPIVWTVFVVIAIYLMDVVSLTVYGGLIPLLAVAVRLLERATGRARPPAPARLDRGDLAAVAGLYVVVVALFRIAFTVFTPARVTGLFLSFAAALVIGSAGPIVYTVWIRRRPLRSLGLGVHNWQATAALAVVLAAVQFSITLARIRLPAAVDWVPLLTMALTVGLFEAVFFRGFIQGRLEAAWGPGPSVLGAAALYALYHVGYGMAGREMLFLFGLGVTYALAYRLTQNILVLWPLLTPLGSLFNQLQSGELRGQLPWASIAGFADVLAVTAVVLWLAHRAERRREATPRASGGAPARRSGAPRASAAPRR